MPEKLADAFRAISKVLSYPLFEINQSQITLLSVILFFFVLFVFFIVSRILDRFIIRRLLPRFQVDHGTQYTFTRISHYLLLLLGFWVAFQFVGIDLSGLAVIFGLLSVGIGFGLQTVTSNFIAGFILLFERPISVGDRVSVGDTEGYVTAINWRATTIKSLDNISIIVPNAQFIADNVINWSHGDTRVRLVVEVGVSYASDLDLVISALQEVAAEHPRVLKLPKPDVLLRNFGDSSWNMQLRIWLDDPKEYYLMQSELNCGIVRKFRDRGIEIPFPQRDLHLRSPLPLPHLAQPVG